MLQILDNNPGLFAIAPLLRRSDGDLLTGGLRWATRNGSPHVEHQLQIVREQNEWHRTIANSGEAVMFRRELLENIHWLDEAYKNQTAFVDASRRARVRGYETAIAVGVQMSAAANIDPEISNNSINRYSQLNQNDWVLLQAADGQKTYLVDIVIPIYGHADLVRACVEFCIEDN